MPDEITSGEPTADPHLMTPQADPDAGTRPATDGTLVQVNPPGPALTAGREPARRLPGFDILGELGRGGMGVVYKARQHGLGRVVALKMVLHGAHATADELDRFRAEAEAIARLRHPNIVEVYAYGETDDGLPYFALEFCDGGTLAAKCGEPVPLAEAVAVGVALARAVQAAHEKGIVHRDLKPANVLLTAAGVPKITDFGLAKGLLRGRELTQTGQVLGTPAYMAPEQAAGHTDEVGPAIDVYALGAILYHLLTGRPPFGGTGSVIDTLRAVQHDDPVRPRRLRKEIPADLEAVVLRCLEKAPGERYASAADLAADLERYAAGQPVSTHRYSIAYRVRKRVVRNRRLAVLIVLLVVAVVATWIGAADSGYAVPGGEPIRRRLDRHELSFARPSPSAEALRGEGAAQRADLASHALKRAPRSGGWISGKMREGEPFDRHDAWGQVQATACLLAAPEARDEDLRPLVGVLHTDLFCPNPMCRAFEPGQGWAHYYDNQPATEGCAWALAAIPAALARPNLCTPDERALLLKRLDEVQATLDHCRVRDTGRWNLAARPVGTPPEGNIATTMLMFQGLIELSRAGLPWLGDQARRAALFRATHAAVCEQFDGKGWLTRGRSQADLNDGLTLQLFALLLRAERYGLAEVPPAILAQIPRHLAECRNRSFEHPITTAGFEMEVKGFSDERIVIQRPVRFLWHPWAIEAAARWYARLKRTAAPHEELVAVRRVLGHLVLELGRSARDELKTGYTYVLAETVAGLTALDDLE